MRRILLSVLLLLTSVAAHAQQALPPDSAVLAMIRQRVDEKRSVGIVVGLLDPDGRTRIVAYGDPGKGQLPLDGNTVFEIGSITKVFTAIVLADMATKGEVDLSDPVQKFLPKTVTMPMRKGKQITLAHLAEQSSGLARMPSNFKPADPINPFADYTTQQMYEFVSSYRLPRDPGAQYEYSNLGVGLLGHVLALKAGRSYEDLVRERILKPLGMSNTAITFTPWMRAHLALGHDAAGQITANWDIPSLAGAGALRSTTYDMLKFLDANLHPERKPLGKAIALAQRERASAGAPNMAIGLNWHIMHARADTIVWHNGGTGGYRTFAGFVPSRKVGVVLMSNSGGEGADDIGFHLLSAAIPLRPAAKQRTAIELSDSALQRFVGTYELAPTFALEVTREGSTLWAQATAQPKVQIWPESPTDFFYKVVDAQLSFVLDANGAVTGLILHQGGRHLPARKVK